VRWSVKGFTAVRRSAWRAAVLIVLSLLIAGAATLVIRLPSLAAGALLHPGRKESLPERPSNCTDRAFAGQDVTLHGWACRARGRPRATLIALHGIADNRGSSVGTIERFTARGLDVIAYDSRRHGSSEGEFCTYGYFEKQDLRRVIDTVTTGPVILLGASLGAAVALQEAAEDRRVAGVVAAEVFSDLRTVATERAPIVLTPAVIRQAIAIAESQANFAIDDVSPVKAAASIRAPVLLIHGALDRETTPDHSERVYEALAGPKRLLLVDGRGHNESLTDGKVWTEIEAWVDAVLRTRE
jgi:uncharacterized protein